MKYYLIPKILLPLFILASANSIAGENNYVWVKDTKISSQDVISSSLSSRVVQLKGSKALDTVRKIISGDLNMKLSKYDKKNHRQTAQTTNKSVLPEKIADKGNNELAGEDYIFMLEVEIKDMDKNTRIFAKAQPIYRVRNKEDKEKEDTITVKVKAEPGQAVALGPMYVMPVSGQPADYDAKTMPDAARRCANLVRYFMQELDQKIIGK